jgi:hypothetical protein
VKEPLLVLAFYVAILLLVSLAVYKLIVWVIGGLALGVGG